MSQTDLHRSIRVRRSSAAAALVLFASTSAWADDLALTAMLSPVAGCATAGTENVTLRIFNHGAALPAGTQINLMYSVNAEPAVNQALFLSDTLGANSVLIQSFAVPADLSVPGSYNINVALQTALDTNPFNNSIANITIVKAAATVAGTLSTPAAGGSGTMTLSGHIGSVLQWEESPDGQRWFKLANVSDTQSYSGLTLARSFRVRVANSPCAAALTNTVVAAP